MRFENIVALVMKLKYQLGLDLNDSNFKKKNNAQQIRPEDQGRT